jgi:hypothetical protein
VQLSFLATAQEVSKCSLARADSATNCLLLNKSVAGGACVKANILQYMYVSMHVLGIIIIVEYIEKRDENKSIYSCRSIKLQYIPPK